MKLLGIILDMLFPNRCLECGRTGSYFCSGCLPDLPAADIPERDFIFSIWSYRDRAVKKAVWLMKYRGKRDIAKIFAGAVYERLIEELVDLKIFENFTEPILLPIPLSAEKMAGRGFNQAELIAREVARLGQNENLTLLTDVLYKNKETAPQARIRDRNERMKNLKDCFAVKNRELVRGRNVILIDDVTTTGATLVEAKRTLKKSGARKVIAFTAAH